MSAHRASVAGIVAAAALTLAGCQKDENAVTARSVQPLSIETVSLMQEKGMSPSDPILMRIYKEDSKAEIWKKRKSDGRYALLKSYDICRFSGKLGPKVKEGDKQAPEGFYSVAPGQMNPRSSYYLSFNIGFPNKYDQALGRTGQHLMVHGDCLSAGCYAMTDAQMAEIYALAREAFRGGQKAFQVQALPFRMTAENMARRRSDKNIAFWRNLKEGSDHFEVTKLEPKVDACGKKYVFNASAGALSSFNASSACPSYAVQPEIARAVAAKRRADEAVIAALSKSTEPAPEYVAQNGRLRRTLDQPVIQVAAVPAAPAAVAYAPAAEGAALPAAAPVAMKSEGRLFSRMFRDDEPETRAAPAAVAAAPAPANAAVAAAAPVPPVRAAAPARREVAPQPPVLASSVAEPAATASVKPARNGFGGWMKSVGGLFGGEDKAGAAEAPAAAPVTPASAPADAAPPKRDRSARMPDAFRPSSKVDPRVTSAFAAFD
ncbi:hypothetical protein GCM10008171_27820 [Methylopila jiangsuensis]|uniref:L,D-TPase catalytic domain-containing protein n=1 Tax=Methylopila jiangsuensis TaxID=586230 RepID=A0A9W6JL62_9HYPH|nr:murein L,D-transpeptidase family protein [Methylopila jiangsuensis]MDR6285085.1 murein L,D-transpeptidase YafK [Methylopila jiangsuensis]GLK77528.1 hypothetical protein GCM10008171_27820 [Methylopila jiangsuensis]